MAECAGESKVNGEGVYFKLAAWGRILEHLFLQDESVMLAPLETPEAVGIVYLFEDTLKEVELLVFGEPTWSDPEACKRKAEAERTVDNGG